MAKKTAIDRAIAVLQAQQEAIRSKAAAEFTALDGAIEALNAQRPKPRKPRKAKPVQEQA